MNCLTYESTLDTRLLEVDDPKSPINKINI